MAAAGARRAGWCPPARRRSATRGCAATSGSVPAWLTRPPSRMTHPIGQRVGVEGVVGHDDAARRRSAARWDRSSRRTSARVLTSRAARGSSSSSRRGSPARARARATRCCCPPDSAPEVGRWPAAPRPDPLERARRARRRASARRMPRARSPKATFSTGAQVREEEVVLEHHADGAALGRARTRRSCRIVEHACRRARREPASTASSPARQRSSVVFPAPLGPSTATTSPGRACAARRRGAACRASGRRGRPGSPRRPVRTSPPSHRSRRASSTTNDTSTSSRLRMMASGGFDSRRR